MQVTEANYVCQEPHLPHTKPRIAVQPGLSVCIACNFSAHSGQKLQLNFGPKGLSAILALALQSAVALEILRRVCTPLAYRFLSTSLDQFRIFRNQNHGHQVKSVQSGHLWILLKIVVKCYKNCRHIMKISWLSQVVFKHVSCRFKQMAGEKHLKIGSVT